MTGIKTTFLGGKKHRWTRETDSNEFWAFSKMTHHSSLIPRSYQLFKMAIMSNFPPWESLWMSKSQPTCTLRILVPLGCPTSPLPHILRQTLDRCITPMPKRFRKFRPELKWNGPFWFPPTGIFGIASGGGPLVSVGIFHPKFPVTFCTNCPN